MSRPFLELTEAANRTVRTLCVYDEPRHGREVHIVFTDGTEISIDLEIATRVTTKHYRSGDGVELTVLRRQEEPVRRK
jgi:hypothetical protein